MGRRLKTNVPILKSELIPQWPYLDAFREKDKEYKKAQKQVMTNAIGLDTKIYCLQSHQCGLELSQHQTMSSHQPRLLDHISWRHQMGNSLSLHRKVPCDDLVSFHSNSEASRWAEAIIWKGRCGVTGLSCNTVYAYTRPS